MRSTFTAERTAAKLDRKYSAPIWVAALVDPEAERRGELMKGAGNEGICVQATLG